MVGIYFTILKISGPYNILELSHDFEASKILRSLPDIQSMDNGPAHRRERSKRPVQPVLGLHNYAQPSAANESCNSSGWWRHRNSRRLDSACALL